MQWRSNTTTGGWDTCCNQGYTQLEKLSNSQLVAVQVSAIKKVGRKRMHKTVWAVLATE